MKITTDLQGLCKDKRKSSRWLGRYLLEKGMFKFLAFNIIKFCNLTSRPLKTKSEAFLKFYVKG
jgi:hypothetical protein